MKPNQQKKAIGGSRLSKRSHRPMEELVDLRIKPRHQILWVLSFTQFIKLPHLTKQKTAHYCTEKDREREREREISAMFIFFPFFLGNQIENWKDSRERDTEWRRAGSEAGSLATAESRVLLDRVRRWKSQSLSRFSIFRRRNWKCLPCFCRLKSNTEKKEWLQGRSNCKLTGLSAFCPSNDTGRPHSTQRFRICEIVKIIFNSFLRIMLLNMYYTTLLLSCNWDYVTVKIII